MIRHCVEATGLMMLAVGLLFLAVTATQHLRHEGASPTGPIAAAEQPSTR